MKKLFAILLALMMALSMAACGAAGQSADTAASESYQFSNKADYETLTEETEYWDGGLYGETQTTAAHSGAKKIYRATLEAMKLPELDYFLANCMDSFARTLDELD